MIRSGLAKLYTALILPTSGSAKTSYADNGRKSSAASLFCYLPCHTCWLRALPAWKEIRVSPLVSSSLWIPSRPGQKPGMEGNRATDSDRGGRPVPREALTVVLEPPLPDQAPVAHYAHAGQLQLLFAELHQLAKVSAPVVEEWLSTGEVDLFHTWDRQSTTFPSSFPLHQHPLLF